jgi:hypothetical protein
MEKKTECNNNRTFAYIPLGFFNFNTQQQGDFGTSKGGGAGYPAENNVWLGKGEKHW